MKSEPPTVHPDALAWENWKRENPTSFDARSLGSKTPDWYLENRLYAAFHDGMKAARTSNTEIIMRHNRETMKSANERER